MRAPRRLADFHTLANVFITCVLLWIFCSGAAKDENDVQDVVRTKRVEVVDNAGKVRIVLGNENGNQEFYRLDMYRRRRTKHDPPDFQVLVGMGGSSMRMCNSDGGKLVELSATGGISDLTLYSQRNAFGLMPAAKEPGKAISLTANEFGIVTTFDPVTGKALAGISGTWTNEPDGHFNGLVYTNEGDAVIEPCKEK